MVKLAVLVSGTGSLMKAIIESGLPVEVVVADRPCKALEIAQQFGVEAILLEREDFGPGFDRKKYSRCLADLLTSRGIDVVVMAGFGTILEDPMFERFNGRILNSHPALLPAFKGWHAVREALNYGVKVTGCTIHIATKEVDSGPVLAQEAVPVLEGDTEESLHERIKEVERRLYPQAIRKFIEELGSKKPASEGKGNVADQGKKRIRDQT